MMIAVILGVLIAAGVIFEEKVGKFFEVVKMEFKKAIVSGAYRDQPKREESGRNQIEGEGSPVQTPHYDISNPNHRNTGKGGEE